MLSGLKVIVEIIENSSPAISIRLPDHFSHLTGIQLFGILRESEQIVLRQQAGSAQIQLDEKQVNARELLASLTRYQNLKEIPPRTERLPLPTNVSTSPFSTLDCTSKTFLASNTASALTGKPKLGSS